MIRTRFEQRFTAERMAKDYVAVYDTLGAVLAVPVTTLCSVVRRRSKRTRR